MSQTATATILEHPKLEELLKDIPKDVKDGTIKKFDTGIFDNEVQALNITAPTVTVTPKGAVPSEVHVPDGQVEEGTYAGTQLAITEMFERIEDTYKAYFAVLGVEPTLPPQLSEAVRGVSTGSQRIPQDIPYLTEKNFPYQFSQSSDDKYPPHLAHIPKKDEVSKWEIFNALGLAKAIVLVQKVVPSETFLGKIGNWFKQKAIDIADDVVAGKPYAGFTIADVEKMNREDRLSGTDIMTGFNLGDLSDWYSDAHFGQQQLAGTNPMTIKTAPTDWIEKFRNEAARQKKDSVAAAIDAAHASKSLFVQDYSYFRKAIGVKPDYIMSSKDGPEDTKCWLCASVGLFQLNSDGRMHPLGIVVDYKGSMEASVTIFNRRLKPSDPVDSEKDDWPWRYAKTCMQVCDWVRHEVTIHLVNTHMVEECTIVATNRCMPQLHPVYRILHPHWLRTLSLNAAARETLVPAIIFDLIGMQGEQPYNFINHAYDEFDFVGQYVPNDLPARGFPLEDLDTDPKYLHYPYARNMKAMWSTLRRFVAAMLSIDFHSDAQVAEDKPIQAWCRDIQTNGKIKAFPTIKTLDQLVDAVTMCIHIASPQHTAVNYLQNFYQHFVIAKPPALCRPPPTKLADLEAFAEKDLVASLPINRQRQWLLAAHVPWLLSFRVGDEMSLLNYANSGYAVYKKKNQPNEVKTRDAFARLYSELRELVEVFFGNSLAMTTKHPGTVPYMVMNPGWTAVSILI